MSTLSESSQDSFGWVYPQPPIEYITVPIADQRGSAQLVVGQSYVDVVFHSSQTNTNWILVACEIVNTVDSIPLNIGTGIITSKALSGFRIQLVGVPDTSNYFLQWAINGTVIPPSPATTYALSGPTSGGIGAAASFTVELLADTTVDDTVTVTPSDGGGGGVFAPTSVELTSDEPSATFVYTPGLYGEVTISVTNDGGLTDPVDLTFSAVTTTYTLSGPSAGETGVASTNFTVALPVGGVVTGTVTVTPSSGGGGGSFTPTTAELTTVSPSDTFTYTPASVGTKTISTTNDGGLTNPGGVSYVVTAPFSPDDIAGLKAWWGADEGTWQTLIGTTPAVADGDPVRYWADQSGNGNHLFSGGGHEATLKTNILNGKPILRFDGITKKFDVPVLGVSQPNTWFIVVNETSKPSQCLPIWNTSGSPGQLIFLDTSGHVSINAGGAGATDSVDFSGGFHILTVIFSASNGTLYVDGNSRLGPSACGSNGTGGVFSIMSQAAVYYPGDIAEILLYDTALGSTDRTNITNHLKSKYGIT